MAKCKVCKDKFTPKYSSLQKTCGKPYCAIEHSREVRRKERKNWKKKEKEKLLTKTDYVKQLQVLVNRFVRLRDKDKPCISCNKPLKSKFDAGHYRSVGGSPELRFDEKNINAQCVSCNQHLHGNLINYRIGLIRRFGIKHVDYLEQNHKAKHYSIEEIKDLKIKYKQKIKEIQ